MSATRQNPRLVEKPLASGKISLYLEYYRDRKYTPKLDENGQPMYYTTGKMAGQPMYRVHHEREKEALGLYLIAKPRTPEERQTNKDTRLLAEKIRYEREQEALQDKKGYRLKPATKIDFISFFRDYLSAYALKDKRNIKNALRRFEAFIQETQPRFVIGEQVKLDSAGNAILDKEGNVVKEKTYCLRPEAITLDMVKQFIKYLEDHSVYSGAATTFARFKKVCIEATRQGILKHNPCSELKTKDLPSDAAEIKTPLTAEQLEALCNTHYAGENTEIQKAFIFCCLTGLRWCDCHTLKYSNIDRRNNILSFEQSKTKHSTTAENYSVNIPLEPAALALIGEPNEAGDNELLFKLPSHEMCTKALKRWTKRAGIEEKITWHCARVTFATLLLDGNTNVAIIQSLLGHSSLKYINIYAKARDAKKREALKQSLPALSFAIPQQKIPSDE